METQNRRNQRLQLRGKVIANTLLKTITVLVRRVYRHPVYKKTIYSTKKYLVHDENKQANLHDEVLIMETRPLSARKHFRLVKILTSAPVKTISKTVSDQKSSE